MCPKAQMLLHIIALDRETNNQQRPYAGGLALPPWPPTCFCSSRQVEYSLRCWFDHPLVVPTQLHGAVQSRHEGLMLGVRLLARMIPETLSFGQLA